MQSCRGIQEYVEWQADNTPENSAVEYETKILTYRELDERANQLAHFLVKCGVERNIFVGIYMDRSLEVIWGILAVLKAGGAYVPIDLSYPDERLKFLIDDIGAPVILTQSHLIDKLPKGNKTKYLCLDGDHSAAETSIQSKSRPHIKIQPDDTAYMIYTSGSTGQPKGCVNTHRGIANYLQWTQMQFPLGLGDKVLQKTPLSFDVSVAEIFWPLISGATLVMAKPWGHKESGYILNTVRESKITDLRLVPSMLQLFLDEKYIQKCASLKRIIVSGEALPAQTVKQFYRKLPQTKLFNLYGPTEAAIDCTFWECVPNEDLTSIPIGHPIPNNQIYILDESGSRVSSGKPGEIFIGGVQVAKGYWKRPDLTKERFVRDPFSKETGAVMYKTGDQGRILENGAIEYQGRLDFQVKVRGFRIELGEIESVLLEHPSVRQAAVVAKKIRGDTEPTTLIAYVVPKKDDFSPANLRNFLKAKLPSYMFPALFIPMDSLPSITSGKIDRKALMELQDDHHQEEEDTGQIRPPSNAIEKIIVAVWKEVLQKKMVGRESNYFELGGDSLTLIHLLGGLQKHGVHLNIKDIYTHSTIADLARLIEERKTLGSPAELNLPPILPLSQTSMDSWFPLASGQSYHGPQYAISHLIGPLNVPAFRRSLKKLIDRQWALRTRYRRAEKAILQTVVPTKIEDYFFEVDLGHLRDDEVEDQLEAHCLYNTDAMEGPLARFTLFRVADNEFYFCYNISHSIFDGTSHSILNKELAEFYSAEVENRPPCLSELPVQLVDYALWEKKIVSNPAVEQRLKYWKRTVTGMRVANLPVDFRLHFKSQGQDTPGIDDDHMIRRVIGQQLTEKLVDFSSRQKTTLNLVFLSAFSRLLHQVSGQHDLAFTTLISQRAPEMANIIGCILSPLPFRMENLRTSSTEDLLNQVKEKAGEVQANAVPFGFLSKLYAAENVNESDLLKIEFNFLPPGYRQPLKLPGVTSDYVEIDRYSFYFHNLYFIVEASPDQISYFIDLNKDVFKGETILAMADKFEAILNEMVTSIATRLAS